MKITLRDGNTYNFEPLGYTDAALDFIALQDQMDTDTDDDSFYMGKFSRNVKECIVESLEAGGHSSEEILQARKSVPIVPKSEIMEQLLKAFLGA